MNRPKFLPYSLGFLALSAGIVWAGQITLTTYYPSPTGNYNTLTAQNVSIGTTTTTTAKLLVTGSGTGYVAFNDGGCGGNYAGIGLNGQIPAGCVNYNILSSPTDQNLFLNRPTGAGIHFRENNADQMTIATGGNVGIGNSNPTDANLVVNGYLRVSGNTNPTEPTQGAYLGWNALTGGTGETDFINNQGGGSGGFAFMNTPSGGSPRTTIGEILPTFTELFNNSIEYAYFSPTLTQFWNNSSGLFADLAYVDNVGSPYGLFANGTIATIGSVPNWWAGLFENTGGPDGLYASSVTSGTTYFSQIAAGVYGLYTNGSVYVNNIDGWWAGDFTNTVDLGIYIQTPDIHDWLGYNNGTLWGLLTDGNIQGLSVREASDQRMKKDIFPLTGALDKIQRLNGVTFTWKKSGTKDIGVIAQNVEKVLPEIVKTGPDGMKGVEYGHMAALFIEAIKEQQKEIKGLQKEIEELEKKLGGRK